MIENEIQQLRLKHCSQKIIEKFDTSTTPDQNDASTMEKPDWWNLYTQATWNKLLQDQYHTRMELRMESTRASSTEWLPRTEKKLFEPELRAAYSSTLSSISDFRLYDKVIAGQHLDVIRNLAFEKVRVMGANELLKRYIRLFEIHSLHLTSALEIATAQTVLMHVSKVYVERFKKRTSVLYLNGTLELKSLGG